MNDMLKGILNRRSIRKYKDQSIPKELITTLLQAAMSAPSACNQQPWHFVVIEDKKVLNEISKIHSGFHVLKGSPLAILVCGEPQATQLDFYWEQDCSAATLNIILAAKACELGAVWLGINPRGGEDSDTIRKIVNLPDHIVPFSLVSVGYAAEAPAPADRYNESKIHYGSLWC
ncbi:MAG: nitroreductase family protein [Clostridia bacterium]|nr:nitroreductase family protein [Clostridia bacterium]